MRLLDIGKIKRPAAWESDRRQREVEAGSRLFSLRWNRTVVGPALRAGARRPRRDAKRRPHARSIRPARNDFHSAPGTCGEREF
jgi:hypothetical protein